MRCLRHTVHVGPVDVVVVSDEPGVFDYLAEFYRLSSRAASGGGWTIDAGLGGSLTTLPDRWGVAHEVDRRHRVIAIRGPDVASLGVTVRKVVREALVERCEQLRYTMLHASAFADDEWVVIVVGEKGSGKTTLALRAVLDHGFRYVSNDHLVVYSSPGAGRFADRLTLTSLPTPIPIKVGTYLDLEDRLPEPWDDEGLDIDRFRALPAADRYRHDRRLLYTYRGLGQDNPIEVSLGATDSGPKVVVVLAQYAASAAAVVTPRPVDDPERFLRPHVRFDWVFDPSLNTQHLPRAQRDRDAYGVDARRLLIALADRALVVRWSHHGDPAPLLRQLGGMEVLPCFL